MQDRGNTGQLAWGAQTGETIGDLMEREGVYFAKGEHSRLDGKMQMHHRLHFDQDGYPMLYVFSTSKHFIRTVPALVYSETDVEDVDTDGEDHIYDECRYVCMENPISPPPPEETKVPIYDPLDLYSGEDRMEKYGYYNGIIRRR